MCGIIGYIGPKNTTDVLLQGLRRLEYRGYDSAGIAVHENDQFYLAKEVGRVSELEKVVVQGHDSGAGIAHTRWATHGGVTVENAHPHLSQCSEVVLVHNGIVENASRLRETLSESGIEFRSETDTETLVQIIANFYRGKGPFGVQDFPVTQGDPFESIRHTLKIAHGTWGIAVMFHDRPNEIFAARNGSPLVVGIGDDSMLIASDPHALTPHTRRVIFLNDGEYAHIHSTDVNIRRIDGAESSTNIEFLEEEWGTGEKGDYPHFMLKEIHEQSEALRHCISGRIHMDAGTAKLSGLEMESQDLHSVSRITLLGCGTAYHAARIGALALEHLSRIPSRAEIASEFRHRNPVVDPSSLFFAVSQSGETADTLGAIREVKLKGGQVRGIVNVVGSTIARECGHGAYIHSGPEMAVASTKAFTNMVAAMYLFALQIGRVRLLSLSAGQTVASELNELPEKVDAYLASPGNLDPVVRWVCESKMTFFLGRGFSEPVAKEGALKLMEVAYVPCIAYPSGEMKHGPIALLEKGSPVIVIAPDDNVRDKTLANLQECRARGAQICLIHTEGDPIASEGDISIAVPRTSPMLSPLMTVLPLQLLAYKAGLALECDIDRPRNLAKSVTVE